MTAPRRFGTEDSKTRGELIDATAQLMVEEGYAAVSSRRVAAKAGVKPALVHYYFRTMDDLFVAVFRRGAEANLARLRQAVASDRPLHTLWKVNSDPAGAGLLFEFVALANHRKAIRSEIATYGEQFRRVEREAVTRAMRRAGVDIDDGELPPGALTVVIAGLTRFLLMEEALGLTTGHEETMALVNRYLRRVEPGL